ncbi:hypothetical protein HDV05_001771, partial [Chytridiales sp. JEL 0842]
QEDSFTPTTKETTNDNFNTDLESLPLSSPIDFHTQTPTPPLPSLPPSTPAIAIPTTPSAAVVQIQPKRRSTKAPQTIHPVSISVGPSNASSTNPMPPRSLNSQSSTEGVRSYYNSRPRGSTKGSSSSYNSAPEVGEPVEQDSGYYYNQVYQMQLQQQGEGGSMYTVRPVEQQGWDAGSGYYSERTVRPSR